MKLEKIKAPLLLRLLDDEPHLHVEKNILSTVDTQLLFKDIKTNLENILNTRTQGLIFSEEYSQLQDSILNYGIDDFSHSYFGNKTSQKKLCQRMQDVITRLETRLSDIIISIVDSDIAMDRRLKLRIEAKINLKPTPVPAVFESCWDIARQKFSIEV